MAKKFPDLTGDGKVTRADVLKGRGVFNDGGEVDNYIQLYQQMQMSLGQAETEEDKNKIRQRFEQSIQGFDQSVIMEAFKKMDALRDSRAMGSLMVPPEREGYGKGGAILDLVAALTGKQTKSAKKKMVDEERALQNLSKMVEDNPRVLDELSDEDYEMVVSKLPQGQAAKMGMADEPLDNMVEMALKSLKCLIVLKIFLNMLKGLMLKALDSLWKIFRTKI